MTQAVNLANFANYLDSGGGMSPSALNAATPVSKGGTGATSLTNGAILRGNGSSAVGAASASDIVTAIGSTYVQNATNATNATYAVNLTTTLAIANGGTGATTSSGALSNLGGYPASNPNGYTSNTGTVNAVATGGGLTGGTITTSGTISLDVYNGSAYNNTVYPIGTTILVDQSGEVNVNTSKTIYSPTLPPSGSSSIFLTVPGWPGSSALSGTWRCRGAFQIGGGYCSMFQRTA